MLLLLAFCLRTWAAEAPPTQCELPATDATANVTIARLKCIISVLDQDRMRESDRATQATAEAAMATARLAKSDAELMKTRDALAKAEAELAARHMRGRRR